MKLIKREFPKEDKIKIKSPNVNLNDKQILFDNKKNMIKESFSEHHNLIDFLLSLLSNQVNLPNSDTDQKYY